MFQLLCPFVTGFLNCSIQGDLDWPKSGLCTHDATHLLPPLPEGPGNFESPEFFDGDGICGQGYNSPDNCYNSPDDCGLCVGRPWIVQGCRKPRQIALTFDDGPLTGTTPKILDHLKFANECMTGGQKVYVRERNISATFYVVGKQALNRPDLLKRMLAEGHMVGGHSWEHANLGTLGTPWTVLQEIYLGLDAVFNLTGMQLRHFRPPYGAIDKFNVLERTGLSIDFWTSSSVDWQWYHWARQIWPEDVNKRNEFTIKNVDRILRQMLTFDGARRLNDFGFIFLFHDINQGTAATLGHTLDVLLDLQKSIPFDFVRMDQCTGVPMAYED